MQVPLIRLQCGCNSYEWGKVGKDSAAARFAAATNFSIQEDKPYAELWMGTHPSNPSRDLTTSRTLLDLVQENQMLLSPSIAKKFGQKLPFLFKVLSINKALSIQAHPNKKLAEQLHAKDSKNYPDDNHKPEMAIAITPFEGLCGFRPLEQIKHFLKTVPSLRELVGDDQSQEFEEAVEGHGASEDGKKKALKHAFTSLMESKSDEIESTSKLLIKQAKEEGSKFAGGGGESNDGKELADLMVRLDGQFPNDIGLFVTFFLNYVKLEPGEAMFLKADDIHAYLSGDIIECMASSDNVVRAGFTPKFKDVPTLTSMLTYSFAPISEQKMEPADYPYCKLNPAAFKSDSNCLLYDPPIPEFAVLRTELKADGAKVTMEPVEGPSIVICTSGRGKISVGPKIEDISEGFVYFVGATAELIMEADGDEPFVTFKAFCELEEGVENGFSGKM